MTSDSMVVWIIEYWKRLWEDPPEDSGVRRDVELLGGHGYAELERIRRERRRRCPHCGRRDD